MLQNEGAFRWMKGLSVDRYIALKSYAQLKLAWSHAPDIVFDTAVRCLTEVEDFVVPTSVFTAIKYY